MQSIAYQICGLPIVLHCLENGTVVFGKIFDEFPTIIDVLGEFRAIIGSDYISINGEDYFYNTILEYKEDPILLGWLKQQQM